MLVHTKSVTKAFDVPIQESPYLSKPQTRSSLKKSEGSPSQSTPKPPKTLKKPKSIAKSNPTAPSKPAAAPSTSASTETRNRRISKCASPLKPLSVAALGVSELKDFDIESLCKEPQWEVDDNEWVDVGESAISIVGAHIEGDRAVLTTVDDIQPTDDDSEDEDFVWDSEDNKDSEDVSLDEESDNSACGEDEELEAEVE